jgi:chromate transporter
LLVTLIGWNAAGWMGALVASLAFFLPSSLLIYGAARVWNRYRGSRWHAAVEAGVAPIAAGLVFAGAFAILQSRNGGLMAWVVAILVATFRFWRPNLHPLALLAIGAFVFTISSLAA